VRWNGCRLQVELVKESAAEAQLWNAVNSLYFKAAKHNMRTCQTKGKFLKFASARMMAAMRHSPPGVLYPVHFSSAVTRLALQVGCDARAVNDAPAATMLATCAIVTMPANKEKATKRETQQRR
jgi:hypothetical protein